MNFKEIIVLENDRVRLEPLGLEHLGVLLPIAEKSPDLLKYSPSLFGNKENLNNYIANALISRGKELRYAFIIYDKEKQRYAGSTSFGNVSVPNERLEIGWTWIDKDFQGTGLNKHCKFLLLSYAFEQLRFERVELKTDSRNTQSIKAMEKIGASYEGELRHHMLMPDAYRRNSVCYSIIKWEWEGIKETIFKNFI
ncbi:MAG: GNAT family N-acetyltransferase [Flavobacteriales bacterium]|nr:GNAT family N-acetyltransferase [Flavobacteriales bacterium]